MHTICATELLTDVGITGFVMLAAVRATMEYASGTRPPRNSCTVAAAIVFFAWACCSGSLQPAHGARTPVDAPTSVCQSLEPSPALAQFVDKLPRLKTIDISNGKQLTLGAYKIKQKLHRDLPPTTLYAYGRDQKTASYPGPTLVATRHVESYVRWENHIRDPQHMLTVDRSIMWADPRRGGVPLVTHLHGAEVDSISDGFPDAWYTARGDYGPAYVTQNYTYANSQRPTMLWYHDHTLGMTRLNLLAGLTGLYIIRAARGAPPPPAWLPAEKYEVALLLQDKQFFHNGSINFPNVGDSPQTHPQWCSEYFADTILVNGKAWPYFRVRPRKYRFRLLNAANARVFVLSLSHASLPFVQIGTDGGLLEKPLTLTSVTVAPAERVDFILDFGRVPRGAKVVLNNSGPAPYPVGVPANSPPSTAAVMKFIVESADHPEDSDDAVPGVPDVLRKADPPASLKTVTVRTNFMFEMDDALGSPIGALLNNRTWHDPVTEKPYLNSTEIWEFINFTPDAHPMHIHLVQFRVLNQQQFNLTLWKAGGCRNYNASAAVGDDSNLQPSGRSCFVAGPEGPTPNQVGWKDTVLALPGHVTRFVLRWTSQDGGPFPFDATAGPGYVWHCHILDHEDNDMMRPIKMLKRR